MKHFKLMTAGIAVLLLSACSNNDTTVNDADMTDTTTGVTVGDDNAGMRENNMSFLTEAAYGSMAEVHAGNMGKTQSTNGRIKNFGDMLSRDHTEALQTVKSLAAAKNIVLPTTMSDTHKKMMDDMAGKKGKDFDKMYIDEMIKDHEEDIRKFETALGMERDSAITTFIRGTLPVLRKHLDSANAIAKDLK